MGGEIRYQWDEAKRQSNLQTHGVDFADAHLLDWSAALQIDHTRSGELRRLTYAPIGERLYALVWTERNSEIRIISFRKTNNREMDFYETAQKK